MLMHTNRSVLKNTLRLINLIREECSSDNKKVRAKSFVCFWLAPGEEVGLSSVFEDKQ